MTVDRKKVVLLPSHQSVGTLSEVSRRIHSKFKPLFQKQQVCLDSIKSMSFEELKVTRDQLTDRCEQAEHLEAKLEEIKGIVSKKSFWITRLLDRIFHKVLGIHDAKEAIKDVKKMEEFLKDQVASAIDAQITEMTDPKELVSKLTGDQLLFLATLLAELMLQKESYRLEGVFRQQGDELAIRSSMGEMYLKTAQGKILTSYQLQKMVIENLKYEDEHEIPVMFKRVVRDLKAKGRVADLAQNDKVQQLLQLVISTPSSKLNGNTLGKAFPAIRPLIPILG